MKKQNVEVRSYQGWSGSKPCVNVKVHNFIGSEKIQDEFKCSEADAERAGEFAFENACEDFWGYVQELAHECFGDGVKVHSEGRSGGWALVDGLTPVEEWDAVALAKWGKFERLCLAQVKWLTSWEYVKEAITANRWAEPRSERFNFFEPKGGESACLVDLKAKAIEQGFAPVVRR